jgi:hypothetical protein
MLRAALRLSTLGLLTAFLCLHPQPAHADSILVGTTLVNTTPGPELCPLASGCNNRLSEFSTPQLFDVDDVKVAISGPGFVGIGGSEGANGNFQVSIITNPGSSQTTVATVGSGNLSFNANGPVVTEIFDFSGLSITLDPGTDYYLLVTGANLSWNRDTPLSGTFGTLGTQYLCDPTETCSEGLAQYNIVPFDYGEQISGTAITPEPSTWLLFATGLFLCGSLYFKSRRSLLN